MESIRNLTMNETIEKTAQSSSYTIDEWKRYFDAAQHLKKPDNTINLSLNLSALMGDSLNDFWRYEGSLTTPPCTEGIIWTIFREPIVFTESELESFRTNIYFEDYRDPQPLYDRVVYRSFSTDIISTIPDYQCCSNNAYKLIPKLSFFALTKSIVVSIAYLFRIINE